ncbi:Uma2 family endonuclease [Actinokineospora sp.]|uniref:Uma2 family endonuclease n=1 Tax=Actinokineospora sp. TaxID=1872133 RepID=UPI004037FE61
MAVLVRDALRAARRADLHVVPAVNVRISTAWRTAPIPDVVVLNRKPVGASFAADDLVLAVEIWSPGNPRAERETKMAGYAAAGVPFVWTIDQGDELRGPVLTAYRLADGQYVAENTVHPAGPAAITAAPFPITLDLADLDS